MAVAPHRSDLRRGGATSSLASDDDKHLASLTRLDKSETRRRGFPPRSKASGLINLAPGDGSDGSPREKPVSVTLLGDRPRQLS